MSQSDSFDQTHFIALSGSNKTIKPGDIVGENYALLSLLGEGGMGYVFLAEHNIIGKKYALKIVRPDRLDDTSKQRFKTEARSSKHSQNLQHGSLSRGLPLLCDGPA